MQAAFFDAVKAARLFDAHLDQEEVDGLNAILSAMEGSPLSYAAYALATAYHETAHTMQPVKEIGGAAYFTRMYDIKGNRSDVARELGNAQPGDGAKFCGRGYVQLTGRRNYVRAQQEIGVALVGYPELALRPDVAAKVMRCGMFAGWFTGYKFSSFLPADGPSGVADFNFARRIINGHDRAELIADYAIDFQKALQEGGWA